MFTCIPASTQNIGSQKMPTMGNYLISFNGSYAGLSSRSLFAFGFAVKGPTDLYAFKLSLRMPEF
jgi:hypothetical protein